MSHLQKSTNTILAADHWPHFLISEDTTFFVPTDILYAQGQNKEESAENGIRFWKNKALEKALFAKKHATIFDTF